MTAEVPLERLETGAPCSLERCQGTLEWIPAAGYYCRTCGTVHRAV